MGRIILARSGMTDFDEQDRIVGTLDIPVNVRGRAELVELASELKDEPIEVIYSSTAEASRQSAQLLGEKTGVKVKVLEDLHNQDFGLWQGLEVAEVRRKHRKVYRQWEETPCAICPPEGEMLEHVLKRVRKTIKPILKRSHNSVVLIIAPDPLRQVIRCHLKKLDITHLWENCNGATWEVIEIP